MGGGIVMSWASALYQTYENNQHMVGKLDGNNSVLAPIAHMNARAQIEVTLNLEGEFRKARAIGKEEEQTLIQVTESSAGRASGIAPHPLCDTLSYVAGDYASYVSTEEGEKSSEKFECYLANLKKWKESQYTHPVVNSVYSYLEKSSLIKDLIDSSVVKLKENGTLSDDKLNGNAYEKVIVRFIIIGGTKETTYIVGQDEGLMEAYIAYYTNTNPGEPCICYLSGKEDVISTNHPKGIIASSYGAKLLSANDNQGFTYRGRYEKAEQACVVGYSSSQKIHNALTWLVKKQGSSYGNTDKRTYICWCPEGKQIPQYDSFFGEEEESEHSYTKELYRNKLFTTLHGYKNELNENDQIVILGLEAATTGRLSVTYYNELNASDYLRRIEKWYENCIWYFQSFDEKGKLSIEVKSPSIRNIVRYAYGVQQGAYIDVNDKVMKEHSQRLIHWMVDDQLLSFGLMQSLVEKASKPLAYSKGNWERVLSTACAVIHKYVNDRGGDSSMILDTNNTNRSYVFGRLLAVLEAVERSTYDRKEGREPNAVRLWSAYINHPGKTWATLEELLIPYYQKLTVGQRIYYKSMVAGIVGTLEQEDSNEMNRKLDENYLLGYYLQRAELYKSKEAKGNGEENDSVEE